MNVRLGLCCNDDHGNPDRLERVDVEVDGEDVLTLECMVDEGGPIVRFERERRVRIGRRVVPFLAHGSMVGNIHWESVTLKPKVAAELLTWLLGLRMPDGFRKFESTEGLVSISEAVDRRVITPEDLARAVRT